MRSFFKAVGRVFGLILIAIAFLAVTKGDVPYALGITFVFVLGLFLMVRR